MPKLNDNMVAIVQHLAHASNYIIAAQKLAPAGSDLQNMIDELHPQVDNVAQRICGYKFDDTGKHVDLSPVRFT